jgi:ketosteroid isomerase-like protein
MEAILKAIDARDGETFAALLDPDCVFVAPGVELRGPEAAWTWMTAFTDAFPDIEHHLVTNFDTGSREAAEITITGTHTGPLVSPQGTIAPTGKPIDLAACDILTTNTTGQIRSYHVYFDQAGFMAQLGLP